MDARRGILADFLLATAVLTRLPVGVEVPEDGAVATSCWAFPLVGAGVGFLASAGFFAASVSGLPAGLIGVLAGIAATGALHEDGLADTADGFGGGRDRERKLAIMRDSRVGVYGVLALVFSVGLRVATLGSIGDPIHAGLALVAAHAAARGFLAPAMRLLPPARSDGLGAAAGHPGGAATLVAVAIAAVVALGCLGPRTGIVALACAGLATAGMGMLARRQIGGYTGDVLGAIQQIGEIVMLLVAARS